MSSQQKSSIVKFDQQSSEEQTKFMQQYYRLQSKIYDATRWAFLFGRKAIIKAPPFSSEQPIRIVEIGCGTGYNLSRLAKHFPHAQLIGLDVSPHMVQLAQRRTRAFADRLQIIQGPYQPHHTWFAPEVDLMLFSYSLTMINPQWSSLLIQAQHDLRTGGIIAVTDFHDSPKQWFKQHMSNHHVRMDGHLLPFLEATFTPLQQEVANAYGGIWQYFLFTGSKAMQPKKH